MIRAITLRLANHPARDLIRGLENRLHHPFAGGMLLAIVLAVYAFAYVRHPLFPGSGVDAPARGWWTWNDQQRYLEEARSIALGQLDATTYHYPVGYPALGGVFVHWMPSHPFLVPDLLLVGIAASIWWKLARRWLSATAALLVAIGFVVTHLELLGVALIVPWTTIATQTTMWGGIAIVLCRQGQSAVLWLAVLAALTYVIRPIDAVTFGPLLLFAVGRIAEWREKISVAAIGCAVVTSAVVGIGLLNRQIFGQWRTPYDIVSMQTIGFFGYPIGYKLYWLLVDGNAFFGETQPGLLFRYPWLFLSMPGIVFLVRREHGVGLAIATALVLNLGLYLNYNDLLPSDIYRFTLIHYLTWSFPLLLVLGIAALRHGCHDRVVQVALLGAAIIAVLALGIQMKPQVVESRLANQRANVLPEHRPLLLEFPNTPMGLVSDLRLDGHGLTEYSQYLTPYVPSDLKLLLGKHATGSTLTVRDGSTLSITPVVSVFEWTWWPVWSRVSWDSSRGN